MEVNGSSLYLISVHVNSIHGSRESVKREARYRWSHFDNTLIPMLPFKYATGQEAGQEAIII